jgi:hypothetical protein
MWGLASPQIFRAGSVPRLERGRCRLFLPLFLGGERRDREGLPGQERNPRDPWDGGPGSGPGGRPALTATSPQPPRPPALQGARGRNNSARGRGGAGAGRCCGPRPRPAPRARTPARTGLPPPPAQALPAGAAAAAAAAPAMDVRLYPSAPAVGARPGAEPAGLAHLDYYHCSKVGGGRGERATRAPSDPWPGSERPGPERRARVTWRLGTRAIWGAHWGTRT